MADYNIVFDYIKEGYNTIPLLAKKLKKSYPQVSSRIQYLLSQKRIIDSHNVGKYTVYSVNEVKKKKTYNPNTYAKLILGKQYWYQKKLKVI